MLMMQDFGQYHKICKRNLEKGFSRACQSTAVKDHLFKAVRLENKDVEVDFAFGEKLLLPDAITLNPLKVEILMTSQFQYLVMTVYFRQITWKIF
jgi:hypothetical protein